MLMKYKNYAQFWTELGLGISNFLFVNSDPQQDLFEMGNALKEAVVFLYTQWY